MWWRELFFTSLYTGYSPLAPGTAGTLVGMAIYYLEYLLLGQYSWVCNLLIVIVMLYPAVRLGDAGERFFGDKDPSQVVLDETMGYWISVLFYPFNWKIAIMGFVLFRIMDVLKPFPINQLQNLKGGLGIMADDYLAGVYSNLVILAVLTVLYFNGLSLY